MFAPVVSWMWVSGRASTTWMRSGFRYTESRSWLSLWRTIIVPPKGNRGEKGHAPARTAARSWPSAPTRWGLTGRLALQVDAVLEHVVGRGDDARVGLEAALRADHGRELGREVDVGHLQRAGDGHAEAAAVRRAHRRRAGR